MKGDAVIAFTMHGSIDQYILNKIFSIEVVDLGIQIQKIMCIDLLTQYRNLYPHKSLGFTRAFWS